MAKPSTENPPTWTLLTRHAHALLRLRAEPRVTLRDLAKHLGITERSVQKIVADLEAEGLLERRRVGRRNHYALDLNRRFRHPLENDRPVAEWILSDTESATLGGREPNDRPEPHR